MSEQNNHDEGEQPATMSRLRRGRRDRRVEARQRRHHRPFRIAEPTWDADERARLGELVTHMTAVLGEAATAAPNPEAALVLNDKDLAEAATNVMRARRRVRRFREDTPESRQLGTYLTATQQALEDAGLVIQDHDGDRYDPRLALEVVAFEEAHGLEHEVVLQTLRPSVYLAGRCIQQGQVIVGGPPSPGGEGNSGGARE